MRPRDGDNNLGAAVIARIAFINTRTYIEWPLGRKFFFVFRFFFGLLFLRRRSNELESSSRHGTNSDFFLSSSFFVSLTTMTLSRSHTHSQTHIHSLTLLSLPRLALLGLAPLTCAVSQSVMYLETFLIPLLSSS